MALFGSSAPAATSTTGDISKDVEVKDGMPTDSISDLSFSPTHDFLAMTSWDKSITIYEVNSNGAQGKWKGVCKTQQGKEEIPLCLAWSTVSRFEAPLRIIAHSSLGRHQDRHRRSRRHCLLLRPRIRSPW
jgi:WD40 repeat protein